VVKDAMVAPSQHGTCRGAVLGRVVDLEPLDETTGLVRARACSCGSSCAPILVETPLCSNDGFLRFGWADHRRGTCEDSAAESRQFLDKLFPEDVFAGTYAGRGHHTVELLKQRANESRVSSKRKRVQT
jgi:hypothetical protein